jgi:DNA-binding CsgD family transcriptional regulator
VLYGRDAERTRIGELLEAARGSRSGALVVRGEPGIGKTALLEDTRERAADMHVLTARGVESESELPFAALHQLLRPAFDHVDRLPGQQAAALRGALGLGDGSGQERFLVFAACLSLLSELAEQRPVLCLVDDAHWLDAASADALRFVARRLDAEGVLLLFGAREGDVRVFEAEDVPSLVLDGLDAGAATTLLARKAGVDAAPTVRDRLVEQTNGNALALLEVSSELTPRQLAGDEPLPEALPMTTQVESVFLERVRRLPEDTQRFLLVAAADDSEDAGLVARASHQLGAGVNALDAAEEAGLVTVRSARIDFRHPLVRSAIYEAASSGDRRAVHRALADALAGDDAQADRRAWHLAASTLEHDEEVVRALEEVAERAEARAGYLAAAKALERAAELSSDPAARGRRLVGAARAASLAGSDRRARDLADQALPLVDDVVLRAEIARVRALYERHCGRPLDGVASLVQAAGDVQSVEPGKALELLLYASSAASEGLDTSLHRQVSAQAATVEIDGSAGPERFLAGVLVGLGSMLDGDTARGAATIDDALEWGFAADDPRHVLWASAFALWIGADERMAQLADRAISLARGRGAIGTLTESLTVRALQFAFVQRFDEALIAAEEALKYAGELGADNLKPIPLTTMAGIAALRGRDDEASERAGEALRIATAHGLAQRAGSALRALGLLDLSRGRWAEALERFEGVANVRGGAGDAFQIILTRPDLIEAAVRADRPEVAGEALPAFEDWAVNTGAPWAQPRLAACRALVTNGDEASAHFEDALRLGKDARPFDLARIQLLYGEHLRRMRRRTDSRAQLRTALDAFEAFGAEPWAERARTELRASGETARKRDPSALSQLTPQELQIARLVADGLSNKEVAAQLFLSPRTIDSHLRNVFAKLGLSSRTQLARLPLGADGELEPSAVTAPA